MQEIWIHSKSEIYCVRYLKGPTVQSLPYSIIIHYCPVPGLLCNFGPDFKQPFEIRTSVPSICVAYRLPSHVTISKTGHLNTGLVQF